MTMFGDTEIAKAKKPKIENIKLDKVQQRIVELGKGRYSDYCFYCQH